MHINTLVALFDHYQNADRAVQALKNYGVDDNHISVVTRDDETIERSGTATTKGVAADGLIGLLASLSALSIPGVGPVVATGTLAITLFTTFGSGATGSLLSALMDLGISETDAEFFAEGVKRGGILISMEADADNEDEINDILHNAGAVDKDIRRQTWQNAGWTSFEEIEKSDEQGYRH